MPHLTLEYTRNLNNFDPALALVAINQAMLDSGLFAEADIKSRAIVLDIKRHRHQANRTCTPILGGHGLQGLLHLLIFAAQCAAHRGAAGVNEVHQIHRWVIG